LQHSTSIAEQGFSIIPNVFHHREIERVLGQIERRNPPRSRAGVRHALRHPEIAELARDRRLIQLASEILGHAAFPYGATLFDKSAVANWLVVWHQDTALPLRKRSEVPGWGPWSVKDGVLYAHAPATALSKVVTLRLHFDDSTEYNGPLRVLPGTHEMGVLTDDEIQQLECRMIPVECIVPASRSTDGSPRPLLVQRPTSRA